MADCLHGNLTNSPAGAFHLTPPPAVKSLFPAGVRCVGTWRDAPGGTFAAVGLRILGGLGPEDGARSCSSCGAELHLSDESRVLGFACRAACGPSSMATPPMGGTDRGWTLGDAVILMYSHQNLKAPPE
jgi:hypothetical protein